jgi:hypothetical protein
MEPFRPKADTATDQVKKPPKPVVVFMLSLFGYPGIGHFMVGAKTAGSVIAVAFTGLTLGILYEIWAIAAPLIRLMTEGTPMDVGPNWWRMAFWVIGSGVLWIGAGLHSYMLAKKMQG